LDKGKPWASTCRFRSERSQPPCRWAPPRL